MFKIAAMWLHTFLPPCLAFPSSPFSKERLNLIFSKLKRMSQFRRKNCWGNSFGRSMEPGCCGGKEMGPSPGEGAGCERAGFPLQQGRENGFAKRRAQLRREGGNLKELFDPGLHFSFLWKQTKQKEAGSCAESV